MVSAKKHFVSLGIVAVLSAVASVSAAAQQEQQMAEPTPRDSHMEQFHKDQMKPAVSVNDQLDNAYRHGYGNQDVMSKEPADAQNNQGSESADQANQNGEGGPYNAQGG
ncbi:hypothetical protein GCM10027040_31700 [Halomonas shantousis]